MTAWDNPFVPAPHTSPDKRETRFRVTHVLVVEDDRDYATLIRLGLSRVDGYEHEVETATTLTEGLRALAQNKFHAVLLDLNLPDSSGLETLTRMQTAHPDVPFVVLTGTDDHDMAVAAMKEGAQDYLLKGESHPSLLARTIRYAIERQRLLSHLKHLNDLRASFIAHAAHELRTPLTALTGVAALLVERWNNLDEERLKIFLDMLDQQTKRARRLASDLLDLSRAESGHLGLSLQTIPLRHSVLEALEVSNPPEEVAVQVDLDNDLEAAADPARIEQVLVNLLRNAYLYGGSNVLITGGRLGDEVVVEVSDDGPGVDPELVPNLFDPFVRGSIDKEGSGLGLTIASRLVEASGGTMAYEPKGSGATFVFRLPAAPTSDVEASA
jgi:K+-sensing histidine kinase KdpD